jgi:hypothetical protein
MIEKALVGVGSYTKISLAVMLQDVLILYPISPLQSYHVIGEGSEGCEDSGSLNKLKVI